MLSTLSAAIEWADVAEIAIDIAVGVIKAFL